jgi:hypothetical protein
MQLKYDRLSLYEALIHIDLPHEKSRQLVDIIANVKIENVYAKHEVDSMLTDAMKEVLKQHDKHLESVEKRMTVFSHAVEKRMTDNSVAMEKRLTRENRNVIVSILIAGLSIAAAIILQAHL